MTTKNSPDYTVTIYDFQVRTARFFFAFGIILSPLTVGNDALVNYPISHFMAYLFSGNTPPSWVFVYCYVFTNILGFLFMFLGSGWSCRQEVCTRTARNPLAILKGNGRKILLNALIFSAVALPLNYFFGDWIRTTIYQPGLSFLFGVSFG
jgi:hypothetical protein